MLVAMLPVGALGCPLLAAELPVQCLAALMFPLLSSIRGAEAAVMVPDGVEFSFPFLSWERRQPASVQVCCFLTAGYQGRVCACGAVGNRHSRGQEYSQRGLSVRVQPICAVSGHLPKHC